MTDYPIPVENWTGAQALTIVCESCHAEEVISGDDILNEGLYTCPRGFEACAGTAVMKYEIAERCGGCDKLGWWNDALSGCCSRSCMLIAEHRATLAATGTQTHEETSHAT